MREDYWGPFTHAIFDEISDAISRTKRTNAFFAKHRVEWKESYQILFVDTRLPNFR